MKPKPFSALNHFTVPCGIFRNFLLFLPGRFTDFRCTGPVPTAIPSWSARNWTDLQPSQEPRSQRCSCECVYTNTEAATAVSQPRSALLRQSDKLFRIIM